VALKLRVAGWIVFLIGGAIFLLMGGFENPKDPIPWIGLFVALLGMILTSTSNLVAHLDRMKKLRRPPEPPPPGPPQP
jgi:drug/metabolite transporter (DMT)-like permease